MMHLIAESTAFLLLMMSLIAAASLVLIILMAVDPATFLLLIVPLLTQSASVLLLHAAHLLRESFKSKGGLAVRSALRASISWLFELELTSVVSNQKREK